MNWYEILSYVLLGLGIIFGSVFSLKWKHLINLLKQLGEAFIKTGEILDDKKVTKQEALDCLKEWYEVYEAILILLPQKWASKLTK